MANISIGFDNSLPSMNYNDLQRPIVFVVDMIEGFINEGSLHDDSINKIVPDIEEILNKVKPAIFVCDDHDLNSREFDSFPIHCVRGSEEGKVIDKLKRYAYRIFKKNSTNAFLCPDFQDFLEDEINEYQDIVIVGCCTDICIMQFALTLNTYFNQHQLNDKRVIVPHNMVETFNGKGHDQRKFDEFSLSIMLQSGIIVTELGE